MDFPHKAPVTRKPFRFHIIIDTKLKYIVAQNDGNISAFFAGGSECDDLLFCYVIHT